MEQLFQNPVHVNCWLNRLAKVQQLELLYCAFVLLDILARDDCSLPARTRSCLTETPSSRGARSQQKLSPHSRTNGVLLHGGNWPHHQSHRSKGRKNQMTTNKEQALFNFLNEIPPGDSDPKRRAMLRECSKQIQRIIAASIRAEKKEKETVTPEGPAFRTDSGGRTGARLESKPKHKPN